MMAIVLALWGKTKFYVLAAIGAIGAALAFYAKARADGKAAAAAEQAQAREKLREKYDAIDRKPADVDGAYDRLGRLRDDQDSR